MSYWLAKRQFRNEWKAFDTEERSWEIFLKEFTKVTHFAAGISTSKEHKSIRGHVKFRNYFETSQFNIDE